MKVLILEDEFICRAVLQKLVSRYGECHVAVQGQEAVNAFEMALEAGQPYDLVCLDIMVPGLDGQGALKAMRVAESKRGIFSEDRAKIIMTTALNDVKQVMDAYSDLCDGYLTKPISRSSLVNILQELKLIQPETPGGSPG